jgi:uncharacterized alkaline shock family protein YloU
MDKEKIGDLKISEDVIKTISRVTAYETDGVQAIISLDKGLFKNKIIKQNPVKIKLHGDVVEISIGLIVKYGSRVVSVAEKVQKSIKEEVQSMTGITVSKVNVIIAGISFINREKEKENK